MSGHNKWSKIKHKKASTDMQKSKSLGRISQLITLESKNSNGNKNSPGLKSAIDQAKAINMTNINIEKAIKRGVSEDSDQIEKCIYEAYGPGGCAMMIEATTDNKNRTSAEIRHILSKNNYELSAKGSASWMFEKKEDSFIPTTFIKISEKDDTKLETLLSNLLDQKDTENIYTNKEK